ncbi:MAG: hypothetical protein FJ109_07670 [Deltaproteobacteria bacterium]|nr:hypothetical protein [Deltaproteobacteria bacterium]
MSNMYVDWVVGEYFSGAQSDDVYCPGERWLEVGNFDSAVILVQAQNASNLRVAIETAVDRGQTSWREMTSCVWTSWPGPNIQVVRSTDDYPMFRWLRFKLGNASSGAWSGSVTIRLLLKR